ncbi:hypothetical protein [Streptomyces sp. TE33382]
MVVVVLAELFCLSWLVGVITLALVPIFIVPWIHVGRVIQRRTRRQMDENAGLGGQLQGAVQRTGAMLHVESLPYGAPRSGVNFLDMDRSRDRESGAPVQRERPRARPVMSAG